MAEVAIAVEEPVDINRLWAEKTTQLSRNVKRIARGDEDFYQEGLLGIRDGLLRDPHANDSYLLQAAKFAMNNYKNRGKSVDNGSKHPVTKKLLDGTMKTYRKDMIRVCLDKIIPKFQLQFPAYGYPPDIRALDRVCAERFYSSLDNSEAKFVARRIRTLDGHSKKGNSSTEQSVYQKFIRAFGTDEQLQED